LNNIVIRKDTFFFTQSGYYLLDKKVSEQVQFIAQRRGVSADTLINLWVQEKLQEQNK
jgi:hypothetical protein